MDTNAVIARCFADERRAIDESDRDTFLIGPDDLILITGATGFIGSRVVKNLLDHGFRNLRCFARPSSDVAKIDALTGGACGGMRVELVKGNLLSRDDCSVATKDAAVVLHLAAARGEKSFPDAFMNSVVTTRNLLEACLEHQCLRRFVTVSSFTVYSNRQKPRGRLLDESCPVEAHPELRGDPYCFAKTRQDELVAEYGKKFGIPYVIVRPAYVYGPGNEALPGRVGIRTFGIFLHLGGSNTIPLTYVDNCAEAIALAGLKKGVDGEVFNVVDDDLPSSRRFLRLYKQNVRRFASLYVPRFVSYALCYLWERYSAWSEGQLPPVFSRRQWHAYWKKTHYSNAKLKTRLGWAPNVPRAQAFRRYFEACRERRHA
ncbi:MAG: NAD(P)-dependent oxidoreductase [Nitrospirae bacterium]|nr:MAG: NAD(P)-dependent oxidoreductase [Nitrospirota bacterium]